jgi:hypothetical protein
MLEFKEKDNTSEKDGKKKLQKYYDKTTNYHDKTTNYHDIASVLDPRLKLEFFQRENFKKEYVNTVNETH